MRVFPFILLTVMGANCVENSVERNDRQDELDASPLLVVSPDYVDYGDHKQDEGATETITLLNNGTADLTLDDIDLEGDSGFLLVTSELPELLAPGEQIELEVSFTAQTLEHEARLVVQTNDPDVSRATVELLGGGLIPAVFVSPDPYDFGRIEPLCPQTQALTISNIGKDTLIIDSIAQLGEAFGVDEESMPELPISLEPSEYFELDLSFEALDFAEYESELWIGSNAPVWVANQTGEGADGSDYMDEWTQPVSGVADIMFYVDQSCSMEDDKERLVQQFDLFIDELERVDTDYLIMASTQDSGCHNIDYVTPDTVDKRGTFQEAVNGNGGMFTEAGLTVANNAMARSGDGGCNADFARENATVSVVLISDEPDQSPPGVSVTEVVSSILGSYPSTYINAVAGPVPDGCDSADPGFGYYEATTLTGGLFLNICNNDWGATLTSLAELAVEAKLADTFYLRDEPQVDTLLVVVDGEEMLEGWSYDSDANALVFDSDSVPGEGMEISVSYSSAVSCDQ